MPRSVPVAVAGGLAAAALFGSTAFLQGSAPRAELTQPRAEVFLARGELPTQDATLNVEAQSTFSWAASLLGLGAALGLAMGVLAQPARAITAEQFSQLTYWQVKGSGLANRCPTVESNGDSVPVSSGSKIINMCFEPKSFAVEAETRKGKEFVTTKLLTRQTYTLAFIEGGLTPSPITFQEKEGMDFAATTVQLPDGERVPFLFTVKNLVAKGDGSAFKPGFTWGGEFDVPSYRTGGFLDPKGRGLFLGYDQSGLPVQAEGTGQGKEDNPFNEANKVFDIGKGAIEMEVNKVWGAELAGCF